MEESKALVETLFFYGFAALSLLFALGVVLIRRVMWAVLSLMSVLLISAAFYLMLGSEFLAGAQVLVYVGGIVVLIVFAVMLTGIHTDERPSFLKLFNGFLVATTFFIWSSWALWESPFFRNSNGMEQGGLSEVGEVREIGLRLMDMGSTGYILPFELISILLLAVLIGAIVIGRRSSSS